MGGIHNQDVGLLALRHTQRGPKHKALASAEGAQPAQHEAEVGVTPSPPTRTWLHPHPQEGHHSTGNLTPFLKATS